MEEELSEKTACWLKEQSLKLFNLLSNQPKAYFVEGSLAYLKAHTLGGNKELFFDRNEEISYNPRAARLVSVYTQFFKLEDPHTITKIILSTLFYLNAPPSELSPKNTEYLSDFIIKDLETLSKISLSIENGKYIEDISSREVKELLLIHFLDRCRHAHLTKIDTKKCLSLYRDYYSLIPEDHKSIAYTFETWHKRALLSDKKSHP